MLTKKTVIVISLSQESKQYFILKRLVILNLLFFNISMPNVYNLIFLHFY